MRQSSPTKFMAIGTELRDSSVFGDCQVEHVNLFCYHGSHIDNTGRTLLDNIHVAAASKGFGALQQAMFTRTHIFQSPASVTSSPLPFYHCFYIGVCGRYPYKTSNSQASTTVVFAQSLESSKGDFRLRQLTNAEILALWADQRPLQTILAQQ